MVGFLQNFTLIILYFWVKMVNEVPRIAPEKNFHFFYFIMLIAAVQKILEIVDVMKHT